MGYIRALCSEKLTHHKDKDKPALVLAKETYLLATGELELGTTQSLDNLGLETVAGAHRHDRLANVDTGNGSLGLTEGTTHSSLESATERNRLLSLERLFQLYNCLKVIADL